MLNYIGKEEMMNKTALNCSGKERYLRHIARANHIIFKEILNNLCLEKGGVDNG